ncbi:hypothetical protein [Mycoplasma nasistruthionis]|uniref:Variable surface lipoprotein n=1 Tax=Mycoplasma nasistruthionis TaxID=353852 RepID=A0A5B7XUW4_9MOLU|nr:hypothetical protein [Mycoplasma nasistruthionis]QCZ36678.1 hypothetical protein FG904_01460 [Mycoplasma nasistruthionis]
MKLRFKKAFNLLGLSLVISSPALVALSCQDTTNTNNNNNNNNPNNPEQPVNPAKQTTPGETNGSAEGNNEGQPAESNPENTSDVQTTLSEEKRNKLTDLKTKISELKTALDYNAEKQTELNDIVTTIDSILETNQDVSDEIVNQIETKYNEVKTAHEEHLAAEEAKRQAELNKVDKPAEPTWNFNSTVLSENVPASSEELRSESGQPLYTENYINITKRRRPAGQTRYEYYNTVIKAEAPEVPENIRLDVEDYKIKETLLKLRQKFLTRFFTSRQVTVGGSTVTEYNFLTSLRDVDRFYISRNILTIDWLLSKGALYSRFAPYLEGEQINPDARIDFTTPSKAWTYYYIDNLDSRSKNNGNV